jgi:hypothetical protein
MISNARVIENEGGGVIGVSSTPTTLIPGPEVSNCLGGRIHLTRLRIAARVMEIRRATRRKMRLLA